MTAGRQINNLSQSWGTPLKYVNAVRSVFGGKIDLDPCSNEYSIVFAKTEFKLPFKDGLKQKWNYKTIYVNPPYGIDRERGTRIIDWLEKCAKANEEYGSEVIALVPVATNTMHWKKYVFKKANAVCFLYDTRLKFLEDGKDTGKGAPMSCAMIYWGKEYRKFYDVFIEFGAVVNLKDLHKVNIGNKIDVKNLSENLNPTLIIKKVQEKKGVRKMDDGKRKLS